MFKEHDFLTVDHAMAFAVILAVPAESEMLMENQLWRGDFHEHCFEERKCICFP